MGVLESVRLALDESRIPDRVGVAFSGGVDSSLVAVVCRDVSSEVVLLTVGFEGSHDMEYAGKVAGILGMPHRVRAIDPDGFEAAAGGICAALDTDVISWQENCIAFHYISRLASDLGLAAVVTANGIDELFCGYDSYRRIYERGPGAIESMIRQKTSNELAMMRAIASVTAGNGVRMEQPLLSPEFVRYSWSVPLNQKIRGADDYLRKHAIRQAAQDAGLPRDVCYKRKKAMQYGTRIHQHLVRSGIQTRPGRT